MVANELVDSCTNHDSIFFVGEYLKMLLRSEQGEDRWNDAGAIGKLALANFVQAKSTNGIRNRLNDLY